jgi:hypothetical protein
MPFDRISYFVPLYEPQSRFLECDVRLPCFMFPSLSIIASVPSSFQHTAGCRLRPNLTHLIVSHISSSSHHLNISCLIIAHTHITLRHADRQRGRGSTARQQGDIQVGPCELASPTPSRHMTYDMHPACSAQLPARVPYTIRLPIVRGSTFNIASIHCIVSCLGDMII